jgi:tRNA pseudouridine38-40 synthase
MATTNNDVHNHAINPEGAAAPLPEQAVEPEQTWHLTLAYDGSAYAGWQVQNTQKTVQGELRTRVRLLFRNPELKVYGGSRTDAGVHALDQQASFSAHTPPDMTPEKLVYVLNRWLPDDIMVLRARICPGAFNPRYDNTGKAYTYCIAPGRRVNPLFARLVWRTPRPLDAAAMRKAAALLCGEHDFSSFAANPGYELATAVRKLYRLEVIEKQGLIYVCAIGESFMYKMVRGLVGYLVHIGAGHAPAEDASRVLAARDRSQAADSAPSQGLFLAKVFWQDDEWRHYQPQIPPFTLI